MSWEQIAAGVELPFADDLVVPELHPYPLDVPSPPAVDDIERSAYDAAVRRFRESVTPGMTIAVGAGSRGLTGRVELVGVRSPRCAISAPNHSSFRRWVPTAVPPPRVSSTCSVSSA